MSRRQGTRATPSRRVRSCAMLSSYVHHRGFPAARIAILLERSARIDHQLTAGVLRDCEAIHAACGASPHEHASRLVLGVVLRAAEVFVAIVPSESRVLVRAGEIERVDRLF